jgi:hypothetical protein
MTELEDRVTRLERRIDQLDRIEARLEGMDTRLGHVQEAVVGLRSDLNNHAHAFAQRMDHFEHNLNRVLLVYGSAQVVVVAMLVLVLRKVGL